MSYLSEVQILFLTQLFRTYSVGLCLGVSTMAMTFYYYVVYKGFTLPEENKMMHIVYRVLRIGMTLALLSEFTCFLYNYHIHNFIYWTDNPELFMRLTIFSVIVINAFAMEYRWINMWFGPVFAGGSWYAYFFFSVWYETETTYSVLFTGYLLWLTGFGIFLAVLRLLLTAHHRKQKATASKAELSESAN